VGGGAALGEGEEKVTAEKAAAAPPADAAAPPSATVWIVTANRGFGKAAESEWHRLFGKSKTKRLSPGDVLRIETPHARAEVLRRLRERPPVFIRHVHPADAVIEPGSREETLRAVAAAAAAHPLPAPGAKTAVQARKAEGARAPRVDLSPIDVKRAVDGVLAERGAVPVVGGMEFVVSVYLTADAVYMGWSTPEENLSSWSGGAMHFRKEDMAISRAKYKLMEAEAVFGLDFARHRSALDIGAAPGGWTSYLLEKGLRVTAVDPAEMHPSLRDHPNLTILRMNAADARFPDGAFDLVVSDMSWDALRAADIVKSLLPAAAPGAPVLTTVKLMRGKAFATLRAVEERMAPEAVLVRAKQLFHNREEMTCLWRRGYVSTQIKMLPNEVGSLT